MAGFLSRLTLAVVPALIALACVLVASGFLIGAFYSYLLALPEPPELAALIVGLVLLALAALVIIAARILAALLQRRASRALSDRGGIGSIASELGARAARDTAAAAEAHPYYTFAAAFLAGLTLGGSPGLRDFVETALRAADGGDSARRRSAGPHS